MPNRHMKRCSTSLIIRNIQTKITKRHHLASVRVAATKTKGVTNVGKLSGSEEIGTLVSEIGMIL